MLHPQVGHAGEENLELARQVLQTDARPSRSRPCSRSAQNASARFISAEPCSASTTPGIWAIALDEPRYELRVLVPEPQTVREAFHKKLSIARLADTVLEDLANVERTHKGVAARVKHEMILQDHEVLVRRYMRILECFEGAESLEDALARCAQLGTAPAIESSDKATVEQYA